MRHTRVISVIIAFICAICSILMICIIAFDSKAMIVNLDREDEWIPPTNKVVGCVKKAEPEKEVKTKAVENKQDCGRIDIGCGDKTIERVNEMSKSYCLTDDEYDLICKVVDLEAGGEGEDLQRTVTECILNRILCGHWGKTVNDVIWAVDDKGIYQFEVCYWLWKADPSELTKRIVKDVFENGSSIPARVMFFRKDYYHSNIWANDEFRIGCVCFSSSKWIKV